MVLEKIGYSQHNWKICGYLKINILILYNQLIPFIQIITIFLEIQGGYTKYPCFICLWDSRADSHHYTQNVWPIRENMDAGDNIMKGQLVDRSSILLPPLTLNLV